MHPQHTSTWPGAQFRISAPLIRAIPTIRFWQDRLYNRQATGNNRSVYGVDHPVDIARRQETAELYQACLILHRQLISGYAALGGHFFGQLS